MKATKHVVIAEKALENSTQVSTLEVSANALWTAVQSPTAEVFLDARIMVVKAGGSNNYADMYRIVGNATGTEITGVTVQQVFHWDVRIAVSGYGGVVTDVTMDVSGGLLRVRLTGSPSATGYTATTWLKAWANG